jgi:hypothetical protein
VFQFLRANPWKIVFTIFLFFGSSALSAAIVPRFISDTFPTGFPFWFYLAWGPCPPGQVCSEFNGLYLVLDLIIWYGISALIVYQLNRAFSKR